jgi:N utilization substance protein B
MNQSKSLDIAEKELFLSLDKTYALYHYYLLLIPVLTQYAENRIEAAKNKLRPTSEDLNPNTRFIDNRFAKQIANNTDLLAYAKENSLSWVNYEPAVKNLYEQVIQADFYTEYMESNEDSYEADREVWRKIFKRCIGNNEELDNSLEEICIYWNDDIDIVLSFVLKTIKRFEENSKSSERLLPMFKDDEDREFASKLFRGTLQNLDAYKTIIDEHTKNWEVDRIAFMDVVIMQTAINEILSFPTIPINVTLNEFIEIAKKYSTERSGTFINGVLDNIVNQFKKENKLIKAKIISPNKK